jgi:hypothetical protein
MTQPKTDGEGRSKRFSLVMGLGGAGKGTASGTVKKNKDRAELAKGVAVGKLNDILGKSKGVAS